MRLYLNAALWHDEAPWDSIRGVAAILFMKMSAAFETAGDYCLNSLFFNFLTTWDGIQFHTFSAVANWMKNKNFILFTGARNGNSMHLQNDLMPQHHVLRSMTAIILVCLCMNLKKLRDSKYNGPNFFGDLSRCKKKATVADCSDSGWRPIRKWSRFYS